MEKALYRRWRPKTFSDVIGQDAAALALKNQVKNQKTGHAYIFTGTRGTGKTSLAKILAKAVNCLDVKDGEPCGECDICRAIESDSLLDITEIDAASNNGVDSIRELRDESAFAPVMARMRVYIIDEVHMLTGGAWAALLKIMEEPPAHVMFILATTEIHKVPATILSRCQRFDLKRIPASLLGEHIEKVAAAEHIDIEPDAVALIARLADGAARDALSILDTCNSLGETITRQTVERLAGVTDQGYLFELADTVRSGDAAGVLALVDRLYSDSVEPARLANELIRHYRNLLLFQYIGEQAVAELPEETSARYAEQSKSIPNADILAALDALAKLAQRLPLAADRRLALELCLLSLAGHTAGTPEKKPVQAAAKTPSPEKTAPKESTAAPKQTEPEPKPVEGPPSSPQMLGPVADWKKVIAAMKQKDGMLYGFMAGSSAFLSDTHVLIRGSEMFFRYMREHQQAAELVKSVIREQTGIQKPIGPYKDEESGASEEAELEKQRQQSLAEIEKLAEQHDIPIKKD